MTGIALHMQWPLAVAGAIRKPFFKVRDQTSLNENL
jgi:hypothetical protein